jgi:hypothetical protein
VRSLAARSVELVPDRVEPCLDAELRDARAHRAETDDAELHSRSTTAAIAMPKPMHIDATP